jgi:hypothetical protein
MMLSQHFIQATFTIEQRTGAVVYCPTQDAPDVQVVQTDTENTVHVQINTGPVKRRTYTGAASVPHEVRRAM